MALAGWHCSRDFAAQLSLMQAQHIQHQARLYHSCPLAPPVHRHCHPSRPGSLPQCRAVRDGAEEMPNAQFLASHWQVDVVPSASHLA